MNARTALDEAEGFLRRFVAYPSEAAATAHVLWCGHAHLVDAFDNSPRIAFLSPEPGSGKSRALEVTEPLVPRPVVTVNASSSYVFRKISDEAGLPTLLMDEVDAIFGRPSDASEDLRGLLNSGYRRGATAGRAAIRGKEIVTEEWPSFCPVAMAGLNALPDTLMTRSIVVHMKRRRPDETVEPYRRRVYKEQGERIYQRLAEWADSVRVELLDAWPELPPGIEDRDADVWEPIIAVADAVGGDWPERARKAAVEMVNEAKSKPATLGIRLLTDLKTVFGADHRLSTNEILDRLHKLETAPWSNIKGEPIGARFLATQLAKYEVPTNNTFKINGKPVKGYTVAELTDAWDRYVSAPPQGDEGEDEDGDEPPAEDGRPTEVGNSGNSGNARPLDTGVTAVTDLRATQEPTRQTA